MQWYYAENGKQMGPFSDEKFKDLTSSGKVTANTLVWHEGMAQWAAYGTLSGPAPKAEPAAPADDKAEGSGICIECGNEFPLQDMIKYEGSTICAECKPTFFQRLQEGATIPGVMDYAGFWIRFAAKFLDNIIVGIVTFVVGFTIGMIGTASGDTGRMLAAQLLAQVFQFAVIIAYSTFFHGKFGATPGKMACKIKVVRADGSDLTYGRALGRCFATGLSYLTMYVGFIMAGFDDEKRSLHDRICDTRVIKKS